MAAKTGTEDVQKTQRSVFVGNIPYEATEEQLKEVFDQVGPVSSFRIVYDRETGKPKGYGFCEYQDLETAQSAMRNLNDYDFHGRNLRVGHAAGETSNAEKALSQAVTGPAEEPMYGNPVEPNKAPEAISRAVASLPPEQMFELMKQMKMCIQNNPNEARNMLLQNPQLAYALLQAQIVMKIVDPQVALAMLHRQSEQIPPLMPTSNEETPKPEQSPVRQPTPVNQSPQLQDIDQRRLPPQTVPPVASMAPALGLTPQHSMAQSTMAMMNPSSSGAPPQMSMANSHMQQAGGPQGNFGPGARGPPGPMGGLQGERPGLQQGGFDNRLGGPGPRGPGPQGPGYMERGDPGVPRGPPNQGFRGPHPNHPNQGGPMGGGMGGFGGPPPPGAPIGGRGDPRDPRSGRMGPVGPPMGGPPRQQGPGMQGINPGMMGGPRPSGPGPAGPGGPGAPGGPGGITTQDQEKAQLIMQVLQLSDEQISLLPPDQRQSILILKEQIARSTNP